MDLTLVLVTLLSLALAATMTVVAWRVQREERRRSEARLAALTAEIYHENLPLNEPAPVATSGDLFATTETGRAASRVGTIAVFAATAIAVAGSLAYLASGLALGVGREPSASVRTTTSTPATHASSAPAAAESLELTALTHDRDADQLIVRGTVRNAGAGTISPFTAVVFVFDRSGNFVTSGRAPIGALASGAGVSFSVTIPGAAEAGRYRVSFRLGDRILTHVDRRSGPAEAR